MYLAPQCVLPETVSHRRRATDARPVLDSALPVLRPKLSAHIPRDHARQVGSQYYIQEAMRASSPPQLVMDLGCGDGSSAELFRAALPDVRWVGVDMAESSTIWAVRGESVVIFDSFRCSTRARALVELSPLNVEIDEWAAETNASVLAVNARKLQFCGQFAFRVRRLLNASG